MSNFKYRWIGHNGFIDANISGLKMAGEDVKLNGKPLEIRKTYHNGDIVEFDNKGVAKMLDANGNWARVPNASKSLKKSKNDEEDKKVEKDKEDDN